MITHRAIASLSAVNGSSHLTKLTTSKGAGTADSIRKFSNRPITFEFESNLEALQVPNVNVPGRDRCDPPKAAPWGGGVHVAKAREVKRRSRGPRPCSTEGARGDDRQTDRHTVRPLYDDDCWQYLNCRGVMLFHSHLCQISANTCSLRYCTGYISGHYP